MGVISMGRPSKVCQTWPSLAQPVGHMWPKLDGGHSHRGFQAPSSQQRGPMNRVPHEARTCSGRCANVGPESATSPESWPGFAPYLGEVVRLRQSLTNLAPGSPRGTSSLPRFGPEWANLGRCRANSAETRPLEACPAVETIHFCTTALIWSKTRFGARLYPAARLCRNATRWPRSKTAVSRHRVLGLEDSMRGQDPRRKCGRLDGSTRRKQRPCASDPRGTLRSCVAAER